jgi:hypothetical protein
MPVRISSGYIPCGYLTSYMARWQCGIGEDGETFERVEDLVVHQANDHDRVECAVCGALVPDGYFAIRHVFDDHSHQAYAREYEADPEAVRRREEIREAVETEADLAEVVDRLEG